HRQAIVRDPGDAHAHADLATVLLEKKDMDGAVVEYRRAVALDPKLIEAHKKLAMILLSKNDLDGAIAANQQVVALNPNDFQLRQTLIQRGRLREARIAWQKALELNPPDHDAWYGYAELCLFLGLEEEYLRACQDLLDRFGATTDPA